MKRKLKQLARNAFREMLMRVAPQFELMPPLTGELADIDLYCWKANSACSLYLMFQPDHRYDCFYIEAGFSSKHQWPSLVAPGLPDDLPHQGELRFRISRLWAPKENFVAWWLGENIRQIKARGGSVPVQVENKQAECISVVMEDCQRRMEEHVIPYFQQFVAGV